LLPPVEFSHARSHRRGATAARFMEIRHVYIRQVADVSLCVPTRIKTLCKQPGSGAQVIGAGSCRRGLKGRGSVAG
jgi:hypothetical protein